MELLANIEEVALAAIAAISTIAGAVVMLVKFIKNKGEKK